MTIEPHGPLPSVVTAAPSEFPGRRLRIFVRQVRGWQQGDSYVVQYGQTQLCTFDHPPTCIEAMAASTGHPVLAALPLRVGAGPVATNLAQLTPSANPSLPDALQDLADEVFVDLHEACAAFTDPDLWYPGVDEAIEPVTDDHVVLVIAAMQRELGRETRQPLDAAGHVLTIAQKLSAAPLDKLPWRIQRAFVERRRLRFAQWGVDHAAWESGTWSLWNVREDPDWVRRWPPPDARGPHAGRWDG